MMLTLLKTASLQPGETIVSDSLTAVSDVFQQLPNGWSIFNWLNINNIVPFWILVSLLCLGFVVLVYNVGCMFLKHGSRTSLRRSVFTSAVWTVLLGGMLVYYVGYDYAGTSQNVLTLLLRSLLSALEMFLSKSNLIGIAEDCKDSMWYMFSFSLVHTLAVVLSAIFAVACFGRRIRHWFKRIYWWFTSCGKDYYVFWGLNERSYNLASDIYKQRLGRIVFVDFPAVAEVTQKGMNFSGLLGLFSYKLSAARQMSYIGYLLLRSIRRPSEVSCEGCDFFDALGLRSLAKMLKRARSVKFFVLTDDETVNLKAAVNMLDHCDCPSKPKIYCSARKTRLSKLIEELYGERLTLIDDSRMAITQLKMGEEQGCYPIDYVSIDPDNGCVTSAFNALIVGFGTTGQDALRFLYEFSAFPTKDGEKSPVRIDVVDCQMTSVEGYFKQEVPAMNKIEGNEVLLHNMNVGSADFADLMQRYVDDWNYVVIAAGSDELNIRVACDILDSAILHQRFKKGQSPFRVFVRLYNDGNRTHYEKAIEVYGKFAEAINYDILTYFGNPEALYKVKIIIDNQLEEKAKKFYKAYCEATGEKKTWEKRREEKGKNSLRNRSVRRKEGQDKANCLHIYTKKRLLGLDGKQAVSPLPNWDDLCKAVNSNTSTSWERCLYNVSICEHLRWNASHQMMGYVTMTEEEIKRGGPSCNEETMQHKYIVGWQQLDHITRSYDYSVVLTTAEIHED